MNVEAELNSSNNQLVTIQNSLAIELEKLQHEKFPQGFPKPIHVLQAVDDNVNGQLEQRLQQTDQDHIKESILLIPYYLGNFHWVGIFIEFKENRQIQRAELIDPVVDSEFLSDKIQKEFDKFYPGMVLFSKELQNHEDPKQSAQLIIQNLVKSVEDSLLIQALYQNANDLHNRNYLLQDNSSNYQKSISTIETLSELQGNKTKFNELYEPLSNVRVTFKNESKRYSLKKQSRIEQQIDDDEQFRTDVQSEINENRFDSLNTHNTTANDSVSLTTDNCYQLQLCESLKNQLQNGLCEHEINDEKELEEEIVKKKQEIESFEEKGRHNIAKKRRESLSKLEELQQLIDKIRVLGRPQTTENLEELRAILASGLSKRDVSDENELKEEIIKKKQEIENLQKQGKYKTVIKRQESLSTLEQLLELIDKIKALESIQSIDNLEELKTSLLKGLLEHDINDEKELEEEIIKRKQEIEILSNKGKHKVAEKRRNSLLALEELQVLNNKIKTLESSNLNMSNEIFHDAGIIISDRQEDDTITKERVTNLYNDFSLMPPCSEKSLINLLFLIALKLNDDKTGVSENNILRDDEIAKELQCFKEQLKIEELESTQIENFIGTVSVNIKDQNWKSAFSTLEKILKLIRPLNIPELFRLFEKVDETAHLIKGEDIILLLGGTGAGKSTTIHFLGGSLLKEIKVTGLNHIHPVRIKNPDLKKITTTPFARSQTQCITPVRIYFRDVGGSYNESIILCDTPGFEDTHGPEVDIANGIGIVKAIKGCKSVKPIVLISYNSIGDRLSGIKDLAHILVKLIPKIEDYIRTLSYIFTKFPLNETNTICALLINAGETLNEAEKSDIAFSNLFRDMINKTRQGARTLDPIKDDAFEILHQLAESKAITYPDEAFQFFITEKSKSVLQEQVRRHQLSIISATNGSDYLLVKYKLDQLKYLSDIPNQEYIKQIYNDCVRYIIRHLSEEYEQSILRLNRCLLNETVLSNEDLKQYQTCIDHANLANDLKEIHLGNEVVHSTAFIENLNRQIDAIVTELKEKEINDPLLRINLDKIKLVSNSFSDIDQ
ncbi:unnamed protein product, partial [Rotaria sordida]